MVNLKYFKYILKKSSCLFVFASILIPSTLLSQGSGEKIFLSTCRACHTIGQGKLVGPDLANIQNRLKQEWIIKWVKSSQQMIKSGDPEAVRIFNEYNKLPMPDNALTDMQIIDILKYIKEKSPQLADTNKSPNPAETKVVMKSDLNFSLDEAGRDGFEIGLQYFTGEIPFKNGGPACLSCHNVVSDNLIGGGLLAKDLTNVFSRLNAAGIDAIISNPPFPVMKTAFENKQLNKEEKYYLLAFLKQADYYSVYQNQVNYNKRFIYSGVIGAFFLFGIFGLVWFKRKKVSVKHDIFKRQLKSK